MLQNANNLEYLHFKITGEYGTFNGQLFRYNAFKLNTIIIEADRVINFSGDTNYATASNLYTKLPNAKFYVPSSLLEEYRSSNCWKLFPDRIYGYDENNPYPTYELEHPWDD